MDEIVRKFREIRRDHAERLLGRLSPRPARNRAMPVSVIW